MEFTVKGGDILKEKAGAAILTVFEGDAPSGLVKKADKALGGSISDARRSGEFSGKEDETAVFHAGRAFKDGPRRIILAGLGKRADFRPSRLMDAAGNAAAAAKRAKLRDVTAALGQAGGLDAEEAAELWIQGSVLALYSFDRFKSKEPEQAAPARLRLVVDKDDVRKARAGVATGRAVAESVCLARDMTNTPANEMTPTVMAERAKEVAAEFGLGVKVMGAAECAALGMGAFLGVASGSKQPPRFIVLRYEGGGKAAPVVLVGKGITFDSGGISIKPVDGMEKMKYDMAGGASVIAALRAAAALRLPVNVVGLVPATENMPSGSALKPGDVVKAMNGKTIEIISTDAEGRLVLSDALCYAQRYKPSAVIDIATLTGACVIALGDLAIGMMANDPGLAERVRAAAEAADERVWELPMWDEYLERMKGDVTDLKNVGGRQAATITAGKFLQQFVGDTPWVHLDIAGTAWEEKGRPCIPKGARGTGVRLLVKYLAGHGA